MFLFWEGLIALTPWGINKLVNRNGSGRERNPLEIVKERYARGEISPEEFERLKKNLA